MKRIFQVWLFVFTTGMFILTFCASWWIFSSYAKSQTINLLRIKLDDARLRIEHMQNNLKNIVRESNSEALSKARLLAKIVKVDSKILSDQRRLETLAQNLDVDELHISDEKGILIACVPKEYVGYDMASNAQSHEFLGALKDPNFVLVQNLRPNGISQDLLQYAGIARQDKRGIVQIGYRSERLIEAQKVADVQYIASSFRVGHNGRLRITPNTNSEIGKEKIFYGEVNGLPSMCCSVPYDKYILTCSLPEEEMYLSRNSILLILVVTHLFLCGALFLLISRLLQRLVINGIHSVNHSLYQITNGNLEEEVTVENTNEFKALSKGINSTVAALKKSIVKEAQRINAELEMGRTIQTSALPLDFPNNPKYRLYASMHAAKEVGGDFYDFFMIDDRHLAVIVADVSGKGITAALYMMSAKALLKESIQMGLDPASAVAQANRELCRNNKAHMFLTAFLAVLDIETGETICVNAGHNPPLIKRGDEEWEYLRIKHSLVLGINGKVRFNSVPIKLSRGDKLFLYTDGVTELKSANNGMFQEERLKDALNNISGAPVEVITKLRSELKNFSVGVPQSDDITMLYLDYSYEKKSTISSQNRVG